VCTSYKDEKLKKHRATVFILLESPPPDVIKHFFLYTFQVLDLGNTGLSEFFTDTFSKTSNVNTLYLNGNRFREIPKEIRHMPLAYLNVNANPIGRLDNESFVGLDRLQQLIVSGMPNLTDIGAGTFVPLKNLVTLYVSHNPVLSNIHRDAFVDHTTTQWSLRQVSACDKCVKLISFILISLCFLFLQSLF